MIHYELSSCSLAKFAYRLSKKTSTTLVYWNYSKTFKCYPLYARHFGLSKKGEKRLRIGNIIDSFVKELLETVKNFAGPNITHYYQFIT